nr:unnamed protein product [Callosobruchus chinensis]
MKYKDILCMSISQPPKIYKLFPLIVEELLNQALEHTYVAAILCVNEPQPSTSKQVDEPHCEPHAETSMSHASVDAENYYLRLDLERATEKLMHLTDRFSFDIVKGKDKLVLLYTGLPTEKIFMSLFNLLKDIEIKYYFKWKVQKMRKIDQLFMTLMKLRQNFPHDDLAVRFNGSQGTVTNVVTTWIHLIHEVLFEPVMSSIPSRSKNKMCLPNYFSSFTNCRIILDCTEVYTSFFTDITQIITKILPIQDLSPLKCSIITKKQYSINHYAAYPKTKKFV